MKHHYSIEKLYHFQCGHCCGWWSVADHQLTESIVMSCPHCGAVAKLEPLEPTEPKAQYKDELAELGKKVKELVERYKFNDEVDTLLGRR